MFGSHRSWSARRTGPLLVFLVTWGVVYLEVFPDFFKTAPECSDPDTDFFLYSIFEVCGLINNYLTVQNITDQNKPL